MVHSPFGASGRRGCHCPCSAAVTSSDRPPGTTSTASVAVTVHLSPHSTIGLICSPVHWPDVDFVRNLNLMPRDIHATCRTRRMMIADSAFPIRTNRPEACDNAVLKIDYRAIFWLMPCNCIARPTHGWQVIQKQAKCTARCIIRVNPSTVRIFHIGIRALRFAINPLHVRLLGLADDEVGLQIGQTILVSTKSGADRRRAHCRVGHRVATDGHKAKRNNGDYLEHVAPISLSFLTK